MPTLWQRLSEMWRSAGLVIRPPAIPEAIQAFEANYWVYMPTDLRDYFLTVDGMEDDLDPGMNRFWPLSMIKTVVEELSEHHSDRHSYPGCFLFADHLIWSCGWAVRLGKQRTELSGPVYLVSGGDAPGPQIAPSFTAFVEMYLADPFSPVYSWR